MLQYTPEHGVVLTKVFEDNAPPHTDEFWICEVRHHSGEIFVYEHISMAMFSEFTVLERPDRRLVVIPHEDVAEWIRMW